MPNPVTPRAQVHCGNDKHRGSVLAEGTLQEIRDRHAQNDLEELFFQLISRHDRQYPQEEVCG